MTTKTKQAPAETGTKYDGGKTRMGLLPFRALEMCGRVVTFGAEQYGVRNWERLEDFEARYFDAAMRHLTAWKLGEKLDEKSHLPHLAHASINLLFLLSKELGFDPVL